MTDEQKEEVCSSLFKLLYLDYDIDSPFLPQLKINALKAVGIWQKELSLSEIPAWIPTDKLLPSGLQQELLLLKAYGLYKRDWCAARGLRPEQVDKETDVDGGCYTCLVNEETGVNVIFYAFLDEFQDNEFQDAACMEALLGMKDLSLWKQYFE